MHFCGGSFVSEDIVVTAAHCLLGFEPSDMLVRLGSTNSKSGSLLVEVTPLKYHEGFNGKTALNYIAVLRLPQKMTQSESIRFIDFAETVPPTGTQAVVSGWGTECASLCILTARILQVVYVDIVQREGCASDTYKYGDQIMESMVCAYALKKNTCNGDSGGPLVADGVLVGVVSWAESSTKKDYPGACQSYASEY